MKSIWLAFAITLILMTLWLRFVNFLAARKWISSKLSRKIIHIGTGPFFVLTWLFFPDHPLARYLAASIPLLITLQFLFTGLGIIKDESSVEALSRSGDRREILKGPLFYGIVFVIVTIIFWKENPLGIIALMVLCGGDGLADLAGRSINSKRIPWSQSKSSAGSLAMFFGGFLLSAIVLFIFIQFGVFQLNFISIIPKLLLISLAATLVESLPIRDWDNVTVPLTVLIIGYFLFL